jgi:hypothetical protein
VERTPKNRELDVLIPTHVGTMPHVEKDIRAIVWAVVWAVEAHPTYGEMMVVLDLVIMRLRCKRHLGKELAMNLVIGVEILSIGTRTAMQATE